MGGISSAACVVLLWVFAVPVLGTTLVFRARNRKSRNARRVHRGVGIALLLAWSGSFLAVGIQIRPWQSGILAQGRSPDGQEYCVVQTFQGFIEPYRVSLYVRDPDRVWHWHYLAHQDNSWPSATVEFTDDSIVIREDGVVRRRHPRKLEPVDAAGVRTGNSLTYYPAHFTVEDVAAAHHEWCRTRA
jgi:hypothetical protein